MAIRWIKYSKYHPSSWTGYSPNSTDFICESVLNWCCENLGWSKFHNELPFIDIDDSSNDWNMMGEYDSFDNNIIIYKKYIHSIDDLINTVIHEYSHFLQSPTWYTRYANNMTIIEVAAGEHPYEIQAEEMAHTHSPKCKEQLNLHDKHWIIDIDTTTKN